jgi:hypothetical protein
MAVCAVTLALCAIGYFAYTTRFDYGNAKEFCAQVDVGMSADTVIAGAEQNRKKYDVYHGEMPNKLRVNFITWHACKCEIGFKEGKVIYAKPWCTD